MVPLVVPWYHTYRAVRYGHTILVRTSESINVYCTMVLPLRHPKGGDAGADARAGPHACEDCGGDPRCRHRCRVGTLTVVHRDVFYADNAHYR
jgi:hypothetical protein